MYTSFLIPNIALNEYQKSKLIDISKMIDIPMNIRYGDFAVEGETVMTGGIKIYNNNLNIIRDFIFF